MKRNMDLVAKGVDLKLHIVDDEKGRPFCDTAFRMAEDGEEGRFCTICACRSAAKAIFMGYADQWQAEVLGDVADRVQEGRERRRQRKETK
jgi:hypothetical protein